MRGSFVLTMAILGPAIFLFAGCQSDPYCQNAIANLRAEKIQLENQYYELKAQYESDMARLGQPVPTMAPSATPGWIEGEAIYPQEDLSGLPIVPGTNISDPGVLSSRRTIRSTVGSSDEEMARFVQSVEVNQLSPQANETVRLLVRPLDDQGAILPIAGDIKIRMYDPASGVTVFENEFSADAVRGWINDQPGLQPGIHVSLKQNERLTQGDRLICDLQYRTADNRILKRSTGIVFGEAVSVTPTRSEMGAQNASAPVMPEESLDEVNIEFGDELNFDSLGNEPSKKRPTWSPDR